MLCGVMCFRYLGYYGLCQGMLLLCYLAEEIGLVNMVWIFGTWCQHVWCGLYGRSGIDVHLKTELLGSIKNFHTLFNWSWIWGFTHYSSLLEFQVSLRFSFWDFCTFLTLCVHHREHKVYLIFNRHYLIFFFLNLNLKYQYNQFRREFAYTPLPSICGRSNWLHADQFNSFLEFYARNNIKQYLQKRCCVTT